jgi:anaerobic ribonucleoside-triphosphate reductase activating protein
MLLRVHSKIDSSSVNGPGRRAVIWVQGCSLACPGCWNPDTHSARSGKEFEIAAILAWIRRLWCDGAVSGFTVSGGEPLEQAAALEVLVTALRRDIPALSVGLFSGYTERELAEGRFRSEDLSLAQRTRSWKNIRACLDFAVLGRFNKRLPSSLPLVSSGNQELVLVSSRYSLDDFEDPGVEITIYANGLTQITGFPVLPGLATEQFCERAPSPGRPGGEVSPVSFFV